MLGPLPRIYRVLVAAAAVALFVAVGAWAAYALPYPVLISAGASLGLAVGAVTAYLLVRHEGPAQQPHRVRRHRLH